MFATKLQSFPNREVRVTYYQVPGVRSSSPKRSKPALQTEISSGESAPPEVESREPLPLDITSELRDSFPEPVSRLRPGFGGTPKPTKFGNSARRKILRSGASLGSLEGGDKRVLFLTGTLPGGTLEAMDALARYSSYCVDRLKTWLSDNGASSYSMYVWELQKRGALHLHYAAYIPPDERGDKIYHGFKQYWYKLLCKVSAESGVDLFARKKGGTWKHCPKVVQAKAVWCNRSVAAYLSKYLGKKIDRSGAGGRATALCPVRWWGVSRPLNGLLKQQTFEQVYYTMRRRDAQIFYTEIQAWLENTSDKCYSYEHKYTGSKVTVAYNTLYKAKQIWETFRMSSVQPTDYNSNSKDWELTTTKLRSMMNRYSITLPVVRQILGSCCAEAAENLQHSKPLSLVDILELANGFHFYLQWKFHDRLHRPKYLEEDVKLLETTIAEILEHRRNWRQNLPEKDGKLG